MHKCKALVIDHLLRNTISTWCRVAKVFIAENSTQLKNKIIHAFVKQDGTARVVFCTEAFGMGMDCPRILQIIHYGISKGIENYIQEVGRGGRSGDQTVALSINVPTPGHTEKEMKQYMKNDTLCRREMLFGQTMRTVVHRPTALCKCCDVCAKKCKCGSCYNLNKVIIQL